MADTVVSTLYPPELDTFQPAFVRPNNETKNNPIINFSISPFNSWESIAAIHVSVVDNKTNKNILKVKADGDNGNWVNRNGILRIKKGNSLITFDSDTKTGTIEIPFEALLIKEGVFENWNLNTYYKVQIRLDGNNIIGTLSDDYMFSSSRAAFSEWSTVTLIKAIDKPTVTFTDITDNSTLPFSTYPGYYRVVGKMEFQTGEQTEYLRQYQIKVFEGVNSDNLVFSTDAIYSQNNEINALIDLNDSEKGTIYRLEISLITNNNYSIVEKRYIKIQDWEGAIFNDDDTYQWHNTSVYNLPSEKDIYVNNEDGCAIIDFTYVKKQGLIQNGIVYIYRSCSKDNYKTREIIYKYKYPTEGETTDSTINFKFEDYTICSLYSYKYFAQYEITKTNQWSKPQYSNEIYPIFYDMLLMRQNTQIAIRYDGKVSSWKPTINRQKIDTLGGKYPKFVENAMMNYKTFQISGIISAEGDYNRKFLNEFNFYKDKNDNKIYYYKNNIDKYDETFGDTYLIRNDTIVDIDEEMKEYYSNKLPNNYDKSIFDSSENINYLHDLYPHNNWYWERTFRDKLVEWLNDGYPKLYRSMPEGNISVVLMDVNLTPKDELGRLLYDFSATMYEVGDGYSLANLDELGIINIPELTTGTSDDSNNGLIKGFGQFIKPKDWPADTNIITDDSTSISNLIKQSIISNKDTQQKYSGIYSDIEPQNLQLENVKFEFSSSPHFYQYVTQTDSSNPWVEIKPEDWYKDNEGSS